MTMCVVTIHGERELEDRTQERKGKGRARLCGNLEPEVGKLAFREGPHTYREKWLPILRQE